MEPQPGEDHTRGRGTGSPSFHRCSPWWREGGRLWGPGRDGAAFSKSPCERGAEGESGSCLWECDYSSRTLSAFSCKLQAGCPVLSKIPASPTNLPATTLALSCEGSRDCNRVDWCACKHGAGPEGRKDSLGLVSGVTLRDTEWLRNTEWHSILQEQWQLLLLGLLGEATSRRCSHF